MTHDANPQQKAAIESPARDLSVMAGAGSGKTRVLTERYARAAHELGVSVLDSVLTITFTDKAAGEIAQRIRDRMADTPELEPVAKGIESAWISTIHGMCSRLLRRHALEAGIDPMFSVGTEVQLGVLQREAFEQVAKRGLDGGGAITQLISSLGSANLYSAVGGVADQLRSLGDGATSVRRFRVQPGRIDSMLLGIEVLLSTLMNLRPSNATIDANTAAVRDVYDALTRLRDAEQDARSVAILALASKQAKRGSQEVKDLAEEGKSLLAEVALVAAQIAVEPLESAFLQLVTEYQSAFSALKSQAQILDFEDLQITVATLFEQHPEIARQYAAQFESVMVDEFQDTNMMQVRLIEAISPAGFVSVGDEKQSIYRFRHADVGLFREKASRSSATLPLSINYRSDPALLTFFNDLFGAEPFWPSEYMKLEPGSDTVPDQTADELFGPNRVSMVLVDSSACGKDKHADEAGALAAHIRALVDSGVPQKDIVILMRTMARADTYAAALRGLGLEAFVASGGTYFDRAEVTDLEMLLRVVANPLDCEALAHVLAGPMTALGADSMGLLRLRAKRGSLWDALAEPESLGMSTEDLSRLTTTIQVVSWARDHTGRIGLADLIHEACERLEYDLTLFARGFDGARAWANVLKLARIAQEFEIESPGDPQAFLDHLRLKREIAGRETLAAFAVEGVDAVRIMSVHAAKGLQFPVTVAATLGHYYAPTPPIMLGVHAGQATLGMKLPCPDGGSALETMGHLEVARAELAADLEESKRVFYVACTRAERALVLCGRSDLSRSAEDDRPIGWLRSALGFAQGDSASAGLAEMGSSAVRVLIPKLAECEMTDAVRPEVDEATLCRARAKNTVTATAHAQQLERISYSGIARYRACPYRFYATSVIRLGSRAPRVSTAESPTAFGSAVHVVLSQALDGKLPSAARIGEICRSAKLAPERWALVEALAAGYLDSHVAKRVANCIRVMREVPFAVPVGDTLLDGAIDLIAFEEDRALVLDYKTGHTDDRFDPTEGYLEQARCYAIAAWAMGAKIVEVSFVELERESRVHTFEFDVAGVTEAISGIRGTLDQIAQQRFGHLDQYDGLVCAECPALGNLCPISAPPKRSA